MRGDGQKNSKTYYSADLQILSIVADTQTTTGAIVYCASHKKMKRCPSEATIAIYFVGQRNHNPAPSICSQHYNPICVAIFFQCSYFQVNELQD